MRRFTVTAVSLVALLCSIAVAYASSGAVDATLAARGARTAARAAPAAPQNFTGAAYASPRVVQTKEERLAQMYAENEWKNSLVMWVLPDSWRAAMPHWTQASKTSIA